MIAVTFARTSRSPLSFRAIADELTDEKSARFHEKWVVGYGHASVAEHAVLHIAIENVSRLAIEAIESNRLASYTEKSTRYQKWTPNSFYTPPEIAAAPLGDSYTHICRQLFDFYQRSLGPVKAIVQQRYPQREGEKPRRWDGRIRSKYVDVCRFVLPAAALANLGMTANARVFENAIRKWLSHPLAEVREIGEQVKAVALAETPTLVKYADVRPYIQETEAALTAHANSLDLAADPGDPGGDRLTLVDATPDAETRFLASLLYRFGECDYAGAMARVRAMSAGQCDALLDEALGRLGRWDVPLREIEHVAYTFDALMDQGAYFEVKRHRMMTQTPQRLAATYGWATPRLMADAGLQTEYEALMAQTAEVYRQLAAEFPHAASYVVPNAFNRRLLMTLNLREVYHFCQLRSAPNAHFSVRVLAGRMYELLHELHPGLTRYMTEMEKRRGWRDIDAEYFT